MTRKLGLIILTVVFIALTMNGCAKSNKKIKIGVSFGVGEATRWADEMKYMEDYAKELGVEMEARLNKTDKPKTQLQDCIEMIDSGIDVLIITARDVNKIDEILNYASSKSVPVICYSRVSLHSHVDLFVGYDSNRIGQRMGQFFSEMLGKGYAIILQGDIGDNNAKLLHEGAMRYIGQIQNNIKIILNAPVPGWSTAEAKKMVKAAIIKNNNQIDGIFAPNDKIAEACIEVLQELGIKKHVVITGMDTELAAAKRIVAGTQDMTIYMDLKELSQTAVKEAVHMAKKEKVNINAEFANSSGVTIKANLITGRVVTKLNIDKILIDSGYFTREEVYGKQD